MGLTKQEIHVVRDADGHPFHGTRDGVEYIYGVAVEQELVDALIHMKDCCESLHRLSRPRNALDTTSEWLAIFCDLEAQMWEVRRLLGDQFDLYDRWGAARITYYETGDPWLDRGDALADAESHARKVLSAAVAAVAAEEGHWRARNNKGGEE